jgi:hypothetical protein
MEGFMDNKMIKQVVQEITDSGTNLDLVIKKMRRANAKLEAKIRMEKRAKELEQAG